jgi:uncharacterized protein YecE (DUF72 family)
VYARIKLSSMDAGPVNMLHAKPRVGKGSRRDHSHARLKHKAIYIGTAGWTIPSRYQDALAGTGSHLQKYSQRLNAAEINSSFRRHHRVQTYERWALSVPMHFRFSVKAPSTLTHDGELTALPEVLEQFTEEVRGLGHKLGVLLVQLPPRLAFDERAVRAFFGGLRKRIDVQIACEPRHPSWSAGKANCLLAEYGVARVAADPPPWPGADEPGGCERLAYFRWHGQPRKYYSDYDALQLASLQQRMRIAAERAMEVWTIFDNTVLGCAMGNALATADAVAHASVPSRRP